MALRNVYSPNWTVGNVDGREPSESNLGPSGATGAHICGSILNAVRAPGTLMASIPARNFGSAQYCGARREEERCSLIINARSPPPSGNGIQAKVRR